MTDAERTDAAWGRIERWLAAHLPGALDNLRAPAEEAAIAGLETALGMPLPAALRATYARHDGEGQGWPLGVFPDGHWFLPVAHVAPLWRQLAEIAAEVGDAEDTFDAWKARIEDGIIFVRGPVKPNIGSPRWIPFSQLEGGVQRFVDFDPPPGGSPGQVIEVDAESCIYQVIAPSFVEFLETYADGLEGGAYAIENDAIVSPGEGVVDPTGWGLPDYLAGVSYEQPASASPAADPMRGGAADGDEVTFEGAMGTLMGGPEMVFTLETASGEHAFLATAELTKGYRAIAVRQHARVRARRYTPDTRSYFVDQAGMEAPDFVAVEYKMLRRR